MADGSPSTYTKREDATSPVECAACGAPVQRPCDCDEDGSGHGIHRDGFCIGPEVPLCCDCGAHELPTCETMWRMIARRQRGQR